MKIVHRPGKTYVNTNALSRIKTIDNLDTPEQLISTTKKGYVNLQTINYYSIQDDSTKTIYTNNILNIENRLIILIVLYLYKKIT